jgi:tetrahydromethanopterin S-methyltransferase subunit B
MRPTAPNAKLIINTTTKVVAAAWFNWLIVTSMDDIFSI